MLAGRESHQQPLRARGQPPVGRRGGAEPTAQPSAIEEPGGTSGPIPFSRRAETLRLDHSPNRAPATIPKAPQAMPVTRPRSAAPRTPPLPAKPTMSP